MIDDRPTYSSSTIMQFYLCYATFSHFDTILECYRQSDTRIYHGGIASCGKNARCLKI